MLHAYFVEDAEFVNGASVRFELGVLAGGELVDREPELVTGLITLTHYKEVLRLLSQESLPLNYLQAHATVQF